MKKGVVGAVNGITNTIKNNPIKTATGVAATLGWTFLGATAAATPWVLPVAAAVNGLVGYLSYKTVQKGYELGSQLVCPQPDDDSSSSFEEELVPSKKGKDLPPVLIKKKVLVGPNLNLDLEPDPVETVAEAVSVEEALSSSSSEEETVLKAISVEEALSSSSSEEELDMPDVRAEEQRAHDLENELGKDHFGFYRSFHKIVNRAPEDKQCALWQLECETLEGLKKLQGERDERDRTDLKNACLREAGHIVNAKPNRK